MRPGTSGDTDLLSCYRRHKRNRVIDMDTFAPLQHLNGAFLSPQEGDAVASQQFDALPETAFPAKTYNPKLYQHPSLHIRNMTVTCSRFVQFK